jgi:hypothetical protein
MPFNSLAYVLLLTVSGAWMALLPWPALALIVASLVFYAVAGLFDTAVFLCAVTLNWLIQARLFSRSLAHCGCGHPQYRADRILQISQPAAGRCRPVRQLYRHGATPRHFVL